jgi:Cu(I)/Ag(I) efflux system membrane fusion protein
MDPANGRKVLYYHDPMVPGNKFDKPAKSPFMDMMLVPVYADGDTDQGKGHGQPAHPAEPGGAHGEWSPKARCHPQVSAVGSIAFNERDQVIVQARATGYVERLHVRATLDRVARASRWPNCMCPTGCRAGGVPVGRGMQGTDVAALVDGARQRMRQVGMSEEQIGLVESSGKTQPRTTISAPIGGVVVELMAREGMTVMAGCAAVPHQRPFHGVGERRSARRARPRWCAQAPRCEPKPCRSGRVIEGRVQAILPEVNAATRTLKARLELNNPGSRWCRACSCPCSSWTCACRQIVLLIPTEAVIQTGKRTVVMLAEDNGLPPGRGGIGIEAGRPRSSAACRPASGGGLVAVPD